MTNKFSRIFFKFTTLSLFYLCFLINNLIAQTSGSINGSVTSNQQPVEYATVVLSKLPDTLKTIHYATTDSLGKFLFNDLGFGAYFLKVTLIGHLPTTIKINLSKENNSVSLNNLIVLNDKNSLSTVTVTAQKKFIQKTTEGFIVNASANITQIGGTATDLLKSTPTVAVDADGGITLRGKKPLILINGRNSAFSSIDQIPASSIESIEIINNASAKYDANAQSGIINIKLKKNKLSGTNGAFSLGAGVGSRGRTANSFVVNHKTPKWNLGLGYDNRFAGRTKHITTERTDFYLPDTYLLNQDRNDERVEKLQNLKFNIDFSPDSKNNFSFEAIGSSEGQDNDETLKSIILKQNKTFNYSNSRHSLELQKAKLGEFAFGYNRKFTDPIKVFSVNLTSSFEKARENTDITTQSLNESQTNLGNPSLQKTHNYENANVSDVIIDYTTHLFKKGILETGFKGTFRFIENDYEASDKIGNNYVINTGSTNIFTFKEQIYAAYLLYHSFIGKEENAKWKYDIGVRTEQVTNNGTTQNSSTKFSNNYIKLFPTLNLGYQITKTQLIKISYAKRINRPDLDELNPFLDITDALNPHSGNPNLKPEIIQAVELGYNKEWEKISFSSNLFYRYSQNTIRNFLQPLTGGAVLRLPVNIGTANSYGFENIITAKPLNYYDFNLSFTIFQQKLNGSNVSAEAIQKGFNWNGKIINNFSLGQKSKLQIIGNYSSAQTNPQGKSIAIYNVDLGFQQKLGKGNSRLGLIIVDAFNSLKSGGYTFTNDFNSSRFQKADTRAFMITFAHSFKTAFKDKLLENKFSKEF